MVRPSLSLALKSGAILARVASIMGSLLDESAQYLHHIFLICIYYHYILITCIFFAGKIDVIEQFLDFIQRC
jgi:hypothetical protein